MIKEIDSFCEKQLGIPVSSLMKRSGAAVAREVRSLTTPGERVLFLCGGGNNGGDGYAAASLLFPDHKVTVFDVFSKGQKTDAGKAMLAEYLEMGGDVRCGIPSAYEIDRADVVVDAIFGTGFFGEIPQDIAQLVEALNQNPRVKVVCVDIPLGVSADDGCISPFALRADVTVCLSYPKISSVSYPAREYCGRVTVDSIGIDGKIIEENFNFSDRLFDASVAKELLPKRADNSNKGSFGKTLLFVGSREYPGAALLALESALRGGAGYVTVATSAEVKEFLLCRFPEAIYKTFDGAEPCEVLDGVIAKQNSVLIGSGCGCTERLYQTVKHLLDSEGAALVLDADAINALAAYGSLQDLKVAKREVILTPHPLEFSRLCGLSVASIEANRYNVAKSFAKENRCTLLLKGASTVVTNGDQCFVNSSGSSALAKAGSGDVLAGLLASLSAYVRSPINAAALAAYIHGAAGDRLAEEYSSYGVTPSDIPKTVAKILAEIERG